VEEFRSDLELLFPTCDVFSRLVSLYEEFKCPAVPSTGPVESDAITSVSKSRRMDNWSGIDRTEEDYFTTEDDDEEGYEDSEEPKDIKNDQVIE